MINKLLECFDSYHGNEKYCWKYSKSDVISSDVISSDVILKQNGPFHYKGNANISFANFIPEYPIEIWGQGCT